MGPSEMLPDVESPSQVQRITTNGTLDPRFHVMDCPHMMTNSSGVLVLNLKMATRLLTLPHRDKEVNNLTTEFKQKDCCCRQLMPHHAAAKRQTQEKITAA